VDMIISGPTVVCPSERHGVHGNLVTILLEWGATACIVSASSLLRCRRVGVDFVRDKYKVPWADTVLSVPAAGPTTYIHPFAFTLGEFNCLREVGDSLIKRLQSYTLRSPSPLTS
jgi:hypothetical protein